MVLIFTYCVQAGAWPKSTLPPSDTGMSFPPRFQGEFSLGNLELLRFRGNSRGAQEQQPRYATQEEVVKRHFLFAYLNRI